MQYLKNKYLSLNWMNFINQNRFWIIFIGTLVVIIGLQFWINSRQTDEQFLGHFQAAIIAFEVPAIVGGLLLLLNDVRRSLLKPNIVLGVEPGIVMVSAIRSADQLAKEAVIPVDESAFTLCFRNTGDVPAENIQLRIYAESSDGQLIEISGIDEKYVVFETNRSTLVTTDRFTYLHSKGRQSLSLRLLTPEVFEKSLYLTIIVEFIRGRFQEIPEPLEVNVEYIPRDIRQREVAIVRHNLWSRH